MAQVVVTGPLGGEFPGGAREFELEAASVFELVGKLDALSPGAAKFIEAEVAIAVDGELIGDWSTRLTDASEVLLVPHIAGGQGPESAAAGPLATRAFEPFGIEIHHDLSAPLTAMESDHLVRLLWEHGLILARGQRLSMERQRELCGLLGPILLRAGETGIMSNEAGEASATELSWHADAAYTRAPFDALSLHALDVVADASSTKFVSAEQGWLTLPPELKVALEGRTVEMISPSYDALGGRTSDRREPAAMKRGEMPAIYRNPHNGRECLWVSELQTASVRGLAWEESRDLLNAVYDHFYRPEAVLEHRWRSGDLVIWDNIALQHMRGSLRNCGKRVLQRVIVGTEGTAPHVGEVA